MAQNEPLMQHNALISAPLEHPCYDGHFPGHPIVPGVLLLELVTRAIGRGAPRGVATLKFQRALTPGASCEVSWQGDDARVTFRCRSEGEPVAEGTLLYGVEP
jgi:3-hydroxymyristoyl/3-hydroxydecanoyl-(acyl carrier protein) dehydratase